MNKFNVSVNVTVESDSMDSAKSAVCKALKTIKTDTEGTRVVLHNYNMSLDKAFKVDVEEIQSA